MLVRVGKARFEENDKSKTELKQSFSGLGERAGSRRTARLRRSAC